METIKILIDSRNVGRIIGPRGATIKDLQEQYRVHISISKESDQDGKKIAEVKGDSQDVQNAIQAINERYLSGGGGFKGRENNNNYRQGRNQESFVSHDHDGARNIKSEEWDMPQEHTMNINNRPQEPKPNVEKYQDWDETEIQSSVQSNAEKSAISSSAKRSVSDWDGPKVCSDSRFNSGTDYKRESRGYNSFRGDSSQGSGSYGRSNRISYRSYDNEPQMNNTNMKTKSSEPTTIIDWDKANSECEAARKAHWAKCPKLIKDFYNEHPDVTQMTDKEVSHYREENMNIVVSRTFDETAPINAMPKPVKKFEQAFSAFPDLLAEIQKAGFQTPSPIQSQMWPILLAGEDCIGIAQTGTGKTLAFLLPALIHTDGQPHPRGIAARGGPNVLVLAPTRELAIQIEKEVAKYQFRGIRAVCLYGGNDRKKQIDVVESGVEIIIATPGRLNDLVSANHIKIESITYLILDEADRMLDMGFEPQIRKLLLDIREDRQTVMTSATWPSGVRRLAASYMKNPYQVFIGSLDLAAVHTVTQIVEILAEEEKFGRIMRFVKQQMTPEDKAIIFCGKKDRADSLSCEFVLADIKCQAIHGNREQSDREQALADIKSGEVHILIATDVASRGLDIEDITYVVNYDFPRNIEEYVHRVGRTGRAGRSGTSLSFMTRSDWSSAAELIGILNEAAQEVPDELKEMAERFKVRKERENAERAAFGNMRRGGGGDRGSGRGRPRW